MPVRGPGAQFVAQVGNAVMKSRMQWLLATTDLCDQRGSGRQQQDGTHANANG